MAAHRLTRRTFLQTAAVAAAAGPFVSTPARAQGFTWKRFQGKELFLMLTKHPFIDVLEKHIPEFESLSGMKVKWETLPEIQARQKLTVEMTANAGGIDAFFTSLHVEKKRFWKAGWYHPLNKFLQDPSLTSPDFDWNDFSPGARAGVTQPDGSISALAAFIDANVLFYRKDLFAAKNVTPPKTLAELEQLVPKLHAPPGTYGIVLRGLKNANATQYPSILFPTGGTYLKDGKAVLDSKEGVAALDLYARLLRQYAPPGVVNFNWYECSASFMQGQVDHLHGRRQLRQPVRGRREVQGGRQGGARDAALRTRGPLLAHLHHRDGGVLAEPQQGGGLPLRAVGHQQDERGARAHCAPWTGSAAAAKRNPAPGRPAKTCRDTCDARIRPASRSADWRGNAGKDGTPPRRQAPRSTCGSGTLCTF